MRRRELLIAAAAAPASAQEPLRRIHSQPAWVVKNDRVELAVTQLGGHMAPVKFAGGAVQPYHVSPWQDEGAKVDIPVLVPLRGDFFCLPFGGGKEPDGREHPAHGETATKAWTFAGTAKAAAVTTLTLTMKTTVRAGKVTKKLMLVDGHDAVYSTHVIEGFAGDTTPGHHATLRLPDRDGAFRLATSEFVYGTTHPSEFASPLAGEYQSFAIGAPVKDLSRVPLRFKDAKEDADMTKLPARTGYVDLMAIFKKPGAGPAWMTAVNTAEGYLWYAFKEPAVLPATVFWLENKGRHGAPWSGRNRCLGLEDVCWYFDKSYEPNPVNRMGIPTAMRLGGQPANIHYIQGAIKTPPRFDVVRTVRFSPGRAEFVAASGERVSAPVSHEFLRTGRL